MKKIKLTFWGTMIRDLILFSIVLFGGYMLVTLMFMTLFLSSPMKYLNLSISSYKDILESENYDTLKSEKILGVDSYFHILSTDGELLYSSKKSSKSLISKEELKYIPDDDSLLYIDEREFLNNADQRTYNMIVRIYDDSEDIITVDKEKKKLIMSSLNHVPQQIDDRLYELLSGKFEGYKITKYKYLTTNKESRYAIFFIKPVRESAIETVQQRLQYLGVFQGIFLFLVVLLYLWTLNKHVKKPVKVLTNAIRSSRVNLDTQPTNYKGPKEFEQIIFEFNTLVKDLKISEDQRISSEKKRKQMISSISHDLKTPLTVMKSYAHAIMDDKLEEKQRLTYLSKISNQCDEVEHRVDRLCIYNSLEHPEFTLNIKSIDICEYFRQYFIQQVEALAFEGYHLDIHIPDETIMYSLDTFQMNRVLDNLLSNSLKYTSKGTTIYFAVEKQSDYIEIIMGNDGEPISPSLRPHLFKEFNTVKLEHVSKAKNSSGLGLSIVKKIIALHGGSIRLLASHNQLTTAFQILLPQASNKEKKSI